jgi:DNA-directed RNA polymerase specialized sigma24 family protein
MSKLSILLNQGVPVGATARAVAEVFDTELNSILAVPISANSDNEFSINPGSYLVRAKLPSGKTLQRDVVIVPGQAKAEVVFATSDSPIESLPLQHFLGYVPPFPRNLSPEVLENAWVRIWSFGDEWVSRPWYGTPLDATEFAIVGRIRPPTDRISLLQIGGERIPWRFIALPPSPYEIEVAARSARTNRVMNGGLNIRITTGDGDLDALLNYEAMGAWLSASTLWKEFSNQAVEYADRKREDANAAAIGFYYLAAHQRLGEHLQWAANFAGYYPWLPDALVIQAMGLLAASDPEGAKQALSRAARLGLTIYSRGLRFLYEQLTTWLEDPQHPVGHEVKEALVRTRRIASAADWNEPRTTFFGATPSAANIMPVYGVPHDSDFTLIGRPSPVQKLPSRLTQPEGNEELALLRRAGERSKDSEEAFNQIYLLYRKEILGYVRARSRRFSDADDIAQETWKILLEKLAQFDPARGNFSSFAKYWATIALLRWYDQPDSSGRAAVLFSELVERYPNASADSDASRIIDAARARINRSVENDLQERETFIDLLNRTFGSSSAPHQLLVFGFCKLLGESPRTFVGSWSDVSLMDLADKFQREYSREIPDRESELSVALAPLQRRLRQRFSDAIHEAATRMAYPDLMNRIVGETTPRDYYRGDPERAVSHWVYSVRRNVISSGPGDM